MSALWAYTEKDIREMINAVSVSYDSTNLEEAKILEGLFETRALLEGLLEEVSA